MFARDIEAELILLPSTAIGYASKSEQTKTRARQPRIESEIRPRQDSLGANGINCKLYFSHFWRFNRGQARNDLVSHVTPQQPGAYMRRRFESLWRLGVETVVIGRWV